MRREGATPRDRSRGVAVLEFTLSLVFLVPLLMATLTFGYYFYVGSNVEEAARQALRQATALALPCAPGPVCAPAVINALTAPTNNQTGTNCTGSAAACYMASPPLSLAASTTVTCTCSIGPPDPIYTISVRVDFLPAVAYFQYFLPTGTTTGTPPVTNTKYTATLAGNN